jgi:parvulin-like peptidyl-prolyl isomerase
MAGEQNLTVSETGWFVRGESISGIGINPQIDEFAFENKQGKISDVFETARGFYIFQIKAKRPAGISPLDEVKQIIKQKLVKIKADSLAYDKAQNIFAQIKEGKILKKAADENNVTFAEPDQFSRDSFIPQIGNPPEFIGAAFSLTEPKQISFPVKTNLGTFIIQLVSRSSIDDSLFVAVKDSVTSVLLQKKQGQLYQDWFAQVKEEAEIKDFRSEYFREY